MPPGPLTVKTAACTPRVLVSLRGQAALHTNHR
nr:MAG TPA_asm: hypothetical protein [Caudoviricetes sp.]